MTLKLMNNLFCWIFFTEMVLKMGGLGLTNYMKDSYNLFDSIVVFLSVIDFVIEYSVDEESIGESADVLQALRALRLMRIIKLVR